MILSSNTSTRRSIFICCAFFVVLTGCTTTGLRNFEAGPYTVIKENDFRITDPVQERELRVRVMYPDAPGPFPVVVFSTGMFCSPQLYDGITDHWVSHGYVVIQPNHPDSPNREGKIPYESLLNIIPVRMRDVSFLAASLDEIEAVRSYLTDWEVAGPYLEKGKHCTQLFDMAFGPESKDAQVSWRKMPISAEGGHPAYLDLLKELNGGEQRVAYLRTRFESPEPRSTTLR